MSVSPERNSPSSLIEDEQLNDFAHVFEAGNAGEHDEAYNSQIDLLRVGGPDDAHDIDTPLFAHGGRAQVWQTFVANKFVSDPVAYDAAVTFGLAGENAEHKKKWTQLLEHVAGVTANAVQIAEMLKKYGYDLDENKLVDATLYDSLLKPEAIEAGIKMRAEREKLETAVLVHDTEKSKELDGARLIAKGGSPAGLENSRDNPVIREGRLWMYLHQQGVGDDVLLAAQNTGRADRYFSELSDYDDSGVKKALEDREKLAELMNVDRDVIDAMTPSERRQASIDAKGPIAAIVGIADAMSAQAKLKGMSDAAIEDMASFYTDKDRNPYAKLDPESQFFFGKDWPEYYKEVRAYLISLVPEESRHALAADFDALTYQRVFNETVLPHTLGEHGMDVATTRHQDGKQNAYDTLSYK